MRGNQISVPKSKSKIHKSKKKNLVMLCTVAVVGIIGASLVYVSQAATSTLTEPEQGMITAPAVKVTDTTASAGGAVKFSTRTASSFDSRMAPLTSIFPTSSWLRKTLVGAPLHPNSPAMVADLRNQIISRYNGVAAFNTWDYSAAIYTVGPEVPKVDIAFYDCQNKGYIPSNVYTGTAQWKQVPIPSDAHPASGADGNLTIYSPSSDKVWEYWKASNQGTAAAPKWQACWGGRIDNVSTNPGWFSGGFGTTATGLPHSGNVIRIKEIQAGKIDHAMSLNVVDAKAYNIFSWPAQRSDGYDPNGTHTIPEGIRFRLDPAVNVSSLDLTPIARTIAIAAQQYGFIIQDKSGAVSIVCESGQPAYEATGVNPWDGLRQGVPGYNIMRNFPWDRMQAMPMDYGKI
jgi:hypothetical protein